jgi:uncharacterized coiled-coil DUF342 family protein
LLRSQKVALVEANERLAQRSTEVADLRLLRDELKSKAAATRAEAASTRTKLQQQQLELGQVIGERDHLGAKLQRPWAGLRPLGVSWLRLWSG